MNKIYLACDYQEGAHPAIMQRLMETNMEHTTGYGTDEYSASAIDKIRQACDCPQAAVHFLIGGTQANATVIDAMLASYQGVIATESGHVSVHEAGAIEFGGHKVLTLPHHYGKIDVAELEAYCENFEHDDNRDHMVMPGMVYISHPTEYGTLYTRDELTAIRKVCDAHQMKLYVDGARLAYALACPENDVTLPDLAHLCDAFYIGGTKCGCLFGEAVVLPDPVLIPHFFTIIKQHGALLAKGRIAGIQFDTLFTDGLYENIGKPAIKAADAMRQLLVEKGFTLAFDSPTNQVFVIVDDAILPKLDEKVVYSFWEKYDDNHTIIRFASSWATTMDDVKALDAVLDHVVSY